MRQRLVDAELAAQPGALQAIGQLRVDGNHHPGLLAKLPEYAVEAPRGDVITAHTGLLRDHLGSNCGLVEGHQGKTKHQGAYSSGKGGKATTHRGNPWEAGVGMALAVQRFPLS
ncbi:hypothetical protein D3C76_968870 [compost metagenome]